MKHRFLYLCLIWCCLFSQFLVANSFEGYQKKALIIGNSNYDFYPDLPSSTSDIELLAKSLDDVGFEVTSLKDVEDLNSQIQKFYQTGSDSTVFFLYYSGYIGGEGREPTLVGVLNGRARELVKLSDIVGYPKGANTMNFLMLDWVTLVTKKEKKIGDSNNLPKWERNPNAPKDNWQIRDYINRKFPNFTKKNVLAMYQKSAARDYGYVETFVESIQKEDWALKDVFNHLEYEIPRTHSIIGDWGSDVPLTRSFFGSSNHLKMPVFPFPPPPASAKDVLPKAYFSEATNLYEVNEKLLSTLEACGYFEKSYYRIPKGFAMVTNIERITEDGAPYPDAERWDLDQPIRSEEPFSIFSYLTSLFTAQQGIYRIIVFMLTSEGVTQSKDKINIAEAKSYLANGRSTLPIGFKEAEFSEDYDCTVLIYEFVKPEYEEANFKESSKHQGRVHLEKNNFLRNLAILSDK